MFIRKFVTTIATTSGLLVLPALPGHAAPSGGCPYPPNRPVLTIDDTPRTTTATAPSTVMGQFKRNNCGIRGGRIVLQRRSLVNGKPSGGWSTFATRTTDSHGLYAAATAPVRDEQVRAVFNHYGAYPTTVSATIPLYVRTHVTENVKILSRCRIELLGRTTPAKIRRTITVQGRARAGEFAGWTSLWSTHTDSKGNYYTTRTLTCGRTYNLAVYIGGDSVDHSNRSRTIFGIKTHR